MAQFGKSFPLYGLEGLVSLENYKGLRSPLPKKGECCFRFSLCFFVDDLAEGSELLLSSLKWVRKHEPDLFRFVRSAKEDLDRQNVLLYMGDPDDAFDQVEQQIQERCPNTTGYLVFNRTAKLGQNDSLPETKEEWNMLAGEFAPSKAILELFDYIERNYLNCNQI